MIRTIEVNLNAAHPELPLVEATTFVGAPSAVFIRGVPQGCGEWKITAVNVGVSYPDNTTTTRAAVRTADGIWTATIPGTATSGRTPAGLRILADGIDENGNLVTGYVLGFADFAVLSFAPIPAPGETFWPLRYFDTAPAVPKKGDVTKIGDALSIYNGTAWEAFDARAMSAAVNALSRASTAQNSINTHANNTTIHVTAEDKTTWNGKQNALTFDNAPTAGSNNPVKSGGIWSAIWGALTALPTGFSSLYDWCVAQLAGKVSKTGDTMTGTLMLDNGGPDGDTWLAFKRENSSGLEFHLDYISLYGQDYYFPYSVSGTIALLSDIYTAVQQIAPAWVSGTAYTVDALVTYNGVVYRCKVNTDFPHTTTPVSDTTHWDAMPVSELFLPLRGGTMKGSLHVNGSLDVDYTESGVTASIFQVTGSAANPTRFIYYDGTSSRKTLYLNNIATLASPAFTGTPTAPTPTAGDSSTKVATTAFVQGALPYAISESIPLTVTSGAAATTLADRTHNVRTVAAPGTGNTTTITATLPAIVAGKSRDMFLNLTVGSAASDAGDISLSIVEPSGATAQIDIGSVEDIGVGENEIMISERALPTTSGNVTTTHWLVTVRHEDFAS